MQKLHHKPKQKGYVNPHTKHRNRSFISWIGYCLGFYKDDQQFSRIPHNFSYPQKESKIEKSSPKITWVNHSTFLVEIANVAILTDPIWSDRCSPFPFAGPKRNHPPGVKLNQIKHVDIVLISHNHYDHLDKATVKELHQKFPNILWIIPKGIAKWFKKLKIVNVQEFDWWDEVNINDQITITAVPTQHFSGRHFWNFNKSIWNGYVVHFHKLNKTFYFVGDTGYNDIHFNEIGEKFKQIDLSIIPIGSYSPQKFMQPIHVSPKEAVDIHRDVGSKLSVGSHYYTFSLSKEKIGQPPFDLYCAMEEAELDHHTFRALEPGQTINW